ncbi:MAG TPA: DUF4412 domain-containing protein [Thermoanaerobaculia bacterium]|nr:DUF4412 domain-containing protein [Thermoanaerobaculia bacterium]
MSRLQRTALAAWLGFATLGPAFAGVHYQAVNKVAAAAGTSSEMQVEAWVSGPKARIEFRSSDNPIARTGSYVLTQDGGKTLYLVDPQDKTYSQWSVDGMLGLVGGILKGLGPLLKIEFGAPRVEKLLEEDGGLVAGQPTRHYRYRTTYTTKVRVFGFGNSSDTVQEQDLWIASKLTDPGLAVWLRSDPPRTGNPDFDQMIAANREKYQGFPLKSATVTTSTQQKSGKQSVSRTSQEVTELSAAAVPDSRFELPAGYQERQLPLPAENPRGGPGAP